MTESPSNPSPKEPLMEITTAMLDGPHWLDAVSSNGILKTERHCEGVDKPHSDCPEHGNR